MIRSERVLLSRLRSGFWVRRGAVSGYYLRDSSRRLVTGVFGPLVERLAREGKIAMSYSTERPTRHGEIWRLPEGPSGGG